MTTIIETERLILRTWQKQDADAYFQINQDPKVIEFLRGPLTMEHLQIITLQSAIDAFRCEHLNQEYTHIAIEDIEDLIEGLDRQATRYLERVNELNGKKDD